MSKVNHLVRAAAHLEDLRPGFVEWQSGEIYVCKKTGSYRYRFGDKSKSPTAWSKLAEKLFDSPAAFALAAMVLAPLQVESTESKPVEKPASAPAPAPVVRGNIIALASAA